MTYIEYEKVMDLLGFDLVLEKREDISYKGTEMFKHYYYSFSNFSIFSEETPYGCVTAKIIGKIPWEVIHCLMENGPKDGNMTTSNIVEDRHASKLLELGTKKLSPLSEEIQERKLISRILKRCYSNKYFTYITITNWRALLYCMLLLGDYSLETVDGLALFENYDGFVGEVNSSLLRNVQFLPTECLMTFMPTLENCGANIYRFASTVLQIMNKDSSFYENLSVFVSNNGLKSSVSFPNEECPNRPVRVSYETGDDEAFSFEGDGLFVKHRVLNNENTIYIESGSGKNIIERDINLLGPISESDKRLIIDSLGKAQQVMNCFLNPTKECANQLKKTM